MQRHFNPIDYCFEWTDDGWYSWDRRLACKIALAERNKLAKELRRKGYKVRVYTLPGQLITEGGIGTGHPEIQQVVPVYGLYYEE